MPEQQEAEIRQAMVGTMPEQLERARARHEAVWDTGALQRDFTVLAFYAPFVAVRRKADGVKGTLQFTHQPRWYFGWKPDE